MTQNELAESLTNNRVPRAFRFGTSLRISLSFPLHLVVQDACLPAWYRSCRSDKPGTDNQGRTRCFSSKKMVNVPSGSCEKIDSSDFLDFFADRKCILRPERSFIERPIAKFFSRTDSLRAELRFLHSFPSPSFVVPKFCPMPRKTKPPCEG